MITNDVLDSTYQTSQFKRCQLNNLTTEPLSLMIITFNNGLYDISMFGLVDHII